MKRTFDGHKADDKTCCEKKWNCICFQGYAGNKNHLTNIIAMMCIEERAR